MSGHSKWATTKRHKAVIDAKRGKIFSMLSKEIMLAARSGGGDINFNPRLRVLVNKGKASNMPNDNIAKAIKKGTGELAGETIDELVYEGYGPSGVGIIVEVTTDNKNRSASEIRSIFGKNGGNMATPGALAFNFQRKGQFLIGAENITEDKLMEVVLEAGAEDVINNTDHFEVLCPMNDYYTVAKALEDAGVNVTESEIAYIPNSTIPVSDEESARKVMKLIDALEDNEDVKNVYSNVDIPDNLMSE